VQSGAGAQLSAVVSGATDAAVMWTADQGAVDGDGFYTAPGPGGSYHVTATSRAAPSRSAVAVVTVTPPSVAIDANKLILTTGGRQQLTATVSGAADTRVAWSVSEGSDGGAVDANGMYTAPRAGGTFHVVAASVADPAQTALAEVTVVATARLTVTISPQAATIPIGGTLQLTATVTGSSDDGVVWTTDSGGVSATGLYTAPAAAGVYHVTAQSVTDPSVVVIATVTVAVAPPTVQLVEPPTAAVETRGIVAFKAHLPGTAAEQVTWSIQEGPTGGTIDALGQYTAPADHEGVYHVVARSEVNPAVSGTATVTVRFFDLLDGGGTVAADTRTFIVWWGDARRFPADAQTGVELLLRGLDGSPYLAVLDQYLRGSVAHTLFGGSLFDIGTPPSQDPLQTTIADEACRALDNNGIPPAPGDMVFVMASAFPGGKIDYCSWHSWGICHGQTIFIAYLPNPVGTPCGQVVNTCTASSAGTSALVGLASHELAEAVTDPLGGGWKDAQGEEIADKCFGLTGCVPLSTGSAMLVPLYSNASHSCVQQ
jgi:hypothetical protein